MNDWRGSVQLFTKSGELVRYQPAGAGMGGSRSFLKSRDLGVLAVLCYEPFPAQAVKLKYERRTGRVLSLEAARDALERLRRAGMASRCKRARRSYVLYKRSAALPLTVAEAAASNLNAMKDWQSVVSKS